MIQLNEYLINKQTKEKKDTSHSNISEIEFLNISKDYNLYLFDRNGSNSQMCQFVSDKFLSKKDRKGNVVRYPYFQLVLHGDYFSLNGMDLDDGSFPIYYYKNSHLDLIMNKPDNMDYNTWNGVVRFLYTKNNLYQLSKKVLDVYDSIK